MRVNSTSCCGLGEMDSISSCQDAAEVLQRVRGTVRYTFLIFSGVTKYDDLSREERREMGWQGKNYGKELADAIKQLKLGKVVASRAAVNYNSGNTIRIWIWEPDWDAVTAIRDYAAVLKPKPKKKKKKATAYKFRDSVKRRSWIR